MSSGAERLRSARRERNRYGSLLPVTVMMAEKRYLVACKLYAERGLQVLITRWISIYLCSLPCFRASVRQDITHLKLHHVGREGLQTDRLRPWRRFNLPGAP